MKFYIACIQKLNEIIQEASNANDNKFMVCPSLRVFEAADFNFLSGETLNQKDHLNRENISMQLNSLSNNNSYWDIDANNNLYDLYQEKISTLRVKDETTVSEDLGDDLEILYKKSGEPTHELTIYSEKLEEYDLILEEYDTLLRETNEKATDEEKKVGQLKLDVLDKKIALHIANWKLNGSKEKIEESLEKENKLSEYDSFLQLIKNIESKLNNAQLTGVQSLNEYSKLQIIPHNFYNNELSWNSLEIGVDELDSLFTRAKKTLKGYNEDILNFDYEENFIEKIKLNYCLINIKRSWLNTSLFNSEFTEIDNNQKKYTYAKKILLIKDIRVTLNESIAKKEEKNIQGNSILKFGPIFMKNQFFINKISKEAFVKPITNKSIYTQNFAQKADKKLAILSPQLMTIKPALKTVKSTQTSHIKAKGNSAKNARIIARPLGVKFTTLPKSATLKAKPDNLAKKVIPIQNLLAKNFMIYNFPATNSSKQTIIHFTINDQLAKNGIYKTEISVKDKNSSFFKEVETDQEGAISLTLPKGTYEINLRKNGYKELSFIQAIPENKNLNIKKELEPQEVVYDSFFLAGIISETITI